MSTCGYSAQILSKFGSASSASTAEILLREIPVAYNSTVTALDNNIFRHLDQKGSRLRPQRQKNDWTGLQSVPVTFLSTYFI